MIITGKDNKGLPSSTNSSTRKQQTNSSNNQILLLNKFLLQEDHTLHKLDNVVPSNKATFISERADFAPQVVEQPRYHTFSREDWKQVIIQTKRAHISFSELEFNLRNGVPEDLRPILWFWLADTKKLERKYSGQYELLKNQASVFDEQINKDITRTCSRHAYFTNDINGYRSSTFSVSSQDTMSPLNSVRNQEGNDVSTPSSARSSTTPTTIKGQQQLFNLLRAYANFDPQLGYVQGMNFLAAHILLNLRVEKYMNFSRSFGKKCLEHQVEERAFLIFCHIMVDKNWRQTYLPGFTRLPALIEELEKKFTPKMKEHFKEIKLEVLPTFQQFYLSLMLKDASSDFGRKIIDLFLHKGESVIEQIILKLLAIYEKEILEIKDPFQNQIFIAQEMLKKALKTHKSDLNFLLPNQSQQQSSTSSSSSSSNSKKDIIH